MSGSRTTLLNPSLKIALGIPTWRDGKDCLMGTIVSCLSEVDEVFIADGLIYGVPGAAGFNVDETNVVSDWLPNWAEVSSHAWESQAAQRTWLLHKAQLYGCDWLLQLDADERLERPLALRKWLANWEQDAFPIPFEYQPLHFVGAAWKLLRVNAWTEIVADGCVIRHVNGTVFELAQDDGRPPEGWGMLDIPWISHHPEARSTDGGRDRLRMNALIGQLEPRPDAIVPLAFDLSPSRVLEGGTMTESTAPATYYCDQCGARYTGPGVCNNGHPPAEVSPLAPAPEESEPASVEPLVPVEGAPEDAATGDVGGDVAPAAAPSDQLAPPVQAAPPAQETAAAIPQGPSVAVQAGPILSRVRAALDDLASLIAKA